MKKTLVFIAIAMAAGVCAAQEVNVGGAVANVLHIDNKGSAVELAYNHQIIPHLYATARFSSYDVAGDVVSFMGNDFAPSVTPLTSSTRAVRVQITKVSTKTSNTPHMA